MTTNRLAKSEAPKTQLTAADFASIAREEGKGDLARRWQAVADERGEDRISDGKRVSFKDGVKIYVPMTKRTAT